MKQVLFILSFYIILVGCSTEDATSINDTNNDETNTNNETLLFLKTIFRNNEIFESFVYYGDNKLKTKINYFNQNEMAETKYVYEADTILEKRYSTRGIFIGMRKYIRINEFLSKIEFYNASGTLNYYKNYNFENNDCGFVSIKDYTPEGEIIIEYNYEYFDSNCSSNIISYTPSSNITEATQYTNDNKKYTEESVRLDFFRRKISHNTIIRKIWNSDGQIVNTFSYNSVFQYNNDNYPIREERTNFSGEINIYTFEYY